MQFERYFFHGVSAITCGSYRYILFVYARHNNSNIRNGLTGAIGHKARDCPKIGLTGFIIAVA
jgi:hypothetical protein